MVLPRSLAMAKGGSSTTGVRGWRVCSGIGWVCGVREHHNAPAGMLGRSRGPPGPPVALATAAACFGHGGGLVVVWCTWPSHRSRLSTTRSTRLFSKHHGSAVTMS